MSKTQEKSNNQVESEDNESTYSLKFCHRHAAYDSFEDLLLSLAEHQNELNTGDVEYFFNNNDPLDEILRSEALKDLQYSRGRLSAIGDLIQAYDYFKLKEKLRPFPLQNDGTDQAAESIDLKESCRGAISIVEECLDAIHNELCEVAAKEFSNDRRRTELHDFASEAIRLKTEFSNRLTRLLTATRTTTA